MKRFLLLALCALFACQAEARTLYVDARRPNNTGNGLSAKKAKKTIQAAINIAKPGDTIVVAAGKYTAPIKSKNKNIRIKAKAGSGKTFIRPTSNWMAGYTLDLGKGNATKMSGFTVSPKPYAEGSKWYYEAGGVKGGSLSSCILDHLGKSFYTRWTFSKAKFAGCALNQCFSDTWGNFATGSTFDRCKVDGHGVGGGTSRSCQFTNTLVADTYKVSMVSCVLGNCTVANNNFVALKGNKAWNTVFHRVRASQFKKTKKNTLTNCYKGTNPNFAASTRVEVTEDDDYDDYECDDYGFCRYFTTVADYHLAAGSPCINKGTKSAAAKKLYGKKDLDGRKRVRGKSVDIGCYEY